MNKRTVLLTIGIVVLILGILGGYFLFKINTRQGKNLVITSQKEETKVKPKGDLIYQDSSGFSFGYPKNLQVEDITPKGDLYYAKIKLSQGKESLTISVYDTKAKTPEAFIAVEKDYQGATLAGAVTLDGISAKQYFLKGNLITVAIDESGVVYLIEGAKDADFWEETQSVVVETFKFGIKSGESESTGDGSFAGAVYEEEEIVE